MPRSDPTDLSEHLINPSHQPKRRLRNIVIGFIVIIIIFAALYGIRSLVVKEPKEKQSPSLIVLFSEGMGAGSPATSDTISTSPAVDRALQVEVLQSAIMQFLSVPSLAAVSSKVYKVFDSELAWTGCRLQTCRIVPSVTHIEGVTAKEVFHASHEASKGLVAYEQRDFEAAKLSYERAISILRDVSFITRLADVKYAMRDRQSAKALYEEAHALDPKNSYAVNGLALFARNHSEEERLLRLAVELDPTNSYALANLGGIIMCEGWDELSRMRNKEAEELLQRFVVSSDRNLGCLRVLER
ncbi:hypothetical protein FOL47_008732 [Perkinsus chesapeaki]|uniref:Tetratricopeptide repeat protein n=1 Tax=Perkinsus chesapeaki TaxID=330153 RepID=A0A7J6LC37_PERCH|nr:hypothetical protein FOL47_008732 [Perkinsus chesapeaki]